MIQKIFLFAAVMVAGILVAKVVLAVLLGVTVKTTTLLVAFLTGWFASTFGAILVRKWTS